MKKASLAAAFAASLSLGSMPVCQAAEGAPVEDARAAEERVLDSADDDARFLAYQPFTREIAASVVVKTSLDQALADLGVPVDEARVAEEQPLGAANEEARFLADQPFTRESASTVVVLTSPDQALAGSGVPADEARVAEEQLLGVGRRGGALSRRYQPFTREIASSVVVSTSLDQALADSGVPAATLLEALRAFSATVNLERDVKRGDRLYVRYEQAFTAEGAPIGVGRVHVGRAHACVARSRRHPPLSHARQGRPPVVRERPVSDAAGAAHATRHRLRVIGLRTAGRPLRPAAAARRDRQVRADGRPLRTKPLPPGLPTGGTSGNGGPVNMATPLGASLGLAPYAGFGSAAPKAGLAGPVHA